MQGKIAIQKGEKQGTQKVLLSSTNAKLTKELAVKALGDKASRYVVKTFAAAKSSKYVLTMTGVT